LEPLEDRRLPSGFSTAVVVKDVPPDFTVPGGPVQNMVNVNGTLFFTSFSTTQGSQLWKSNGTPAGTVLVAALSPTPGTNVGAGNLTNVDGTLFFSAQGASGPALWKSDGTPAGTVVVKTITPFGPFGAALEDLTAVDGSLFFFASSFGTLELWRSDGTAAGTAELAMFPFIGGIDSAPQIPSAAVGANFFFAADDGIHGAELWVSDGTPAGTRIVTDINPGPASSLQEGSDLANVNGRLFFDANDGVHGDELWVSDGTAAGTVMVSDINPGSASSSPGDLTNVNGTAFFTADDGVHGTELWRSDGTAAGTLLVADINPGTAPSLPHALTNVSGTLFFSAFDGVHGPSELWKSDGTAASTVLIKDIDPEPGNPFFSFINDATNVGGVLYFSAIDRPAPSNADLWESNGTPAGTVPVPAGTDGPVTNPYNLTDVSGTLFFGADGGSQGKELRKVAPSLIATGADFGGAPHVRVFNALTGALVSEFLAYDVHFLGGVRVAVGDVTGDGVPDIVTAPGPGGGPDIRVFEGRTGVLVREFLAYDPSFVSGVFVAAGDVNGDGFADIITGADAGGGPHVKVFSGADGTLLASFMAYSTAFTGGVRVAAGDVNGDGFADVVTGAGPGGGPHVEVFSGKDGTLLRSFMAYAPTFAGGVYVAAGDVNGDGKADIITGAGQGGGPHVEAFSGADGTLLQSFLAFPAAFTGGVRVAVVGGAIVAGVGPSGLPAVLGFDGQTLAPLDAFFAYDPAFTSGVFVGGS
jgi:ELWxxDGT repeat protein